MAITPLEQQIIELAKHELNNMQYYTDTPSKASEADKEAVKLASCFEAATCFNRLAALVELAHFQDSALSNEAKGELLNIEAESTRLIRNNQWFYGDANLKYREHLAQH